jgi:hypothetical protein
VTQPGADASLSRAEGEGLFVLAAARLAGAAGLLLGWRPGEFWAATPAELATVLWAAGGEAGEVSLSDLERLKALFPD